MNRFFLLMAAALFVACGGDSNPELKPPTDDAGTHQLDAGYQEPDASTPEPDAGTPEPDAGTPEPDAGTPDAGIPEPEPELTTISSSDPRIQYTGRIDFSGSEPWFSQPGVSIKARFTGSTLHFMMRDFASSYLGSNYYNVTIDNGAPVAFEVRKGTTVYEVASNLAPGEHTVVLTKRTESSVGSSRFLGFQIRGTLLEPPARPTRRMEFIGDSMTCGYGNEVSVPEPPAGNPNTGFHSINENHDKAFPTFTARALGAEHQTVCYSGRGVYRNLDGTTHGTMPLIYDRIIPDQPRPLWDLSRYVPDVVVINLGTNDLDYTKAPADEAAFKAAYTNFVTRIRGTYPNARIVCLVGVMLNDWYPRGAKAWTNAQAWVSAVVQDFNSRGDAQVYYLKIDPQDSPYGEDWHPTIATHQQMADKLTPFVRSITGW